MDFIWRLINQNFVFRPFIFLLKKDEDRSSWRLGPTTAHIFTVLTVQPAGLIGWAIYMFFVKNLFYNKSYAFNTVRLKTRPDGFWRPTNQNFIFGPLYSSWKIINIDLLGVSNRQLLILLQCFTPTVLVARLLF